MPRIRSIKPEFWTDEKIGALSLGARLAFIASWNMADDDGILEWSPLSMKARAFPYDSQITEETVQQWLQEIAAQNLIHVYTRGKANYAIILNFRKHQYIQKPKPSKLPLPSIQNSAYRTAIFQRDGWTCVYCGSALPGYNSPSEPTTRHATLDHIVPRSQGGHDLPHNLVTACERCNKARCDIPFEEFVAKVRSQADDASAATGNNTVPLPYMSDTVTGEIPSGKGGGRGKGTGIREREKEAPLVVAPPASNRFPEWLKLLQRLEGWPKDASANEEVQKKTQDRFGHLSLEEEAQKFVWHWQDSRRKLKSARRAWWNWLGRAQKGAITHGVATGSVEAIRAAKERWERRRASVSAASE